ncbi:hypothetical protein D1872_303330 [compost metagenome]
MLGFIFHLHAGFALLLWLPMLTAGMDGLGIIGAALVLGVAVAYLMRRSQRNKWLKEEEDI